MKNFIFLSFLLLCLKSNSQNFNFRFKVDNYLSVNFPNSPDTLIEDGVKLYYTNTDSISYQAAVSTEYFDIGSEEKYQDALKGMVKGAVSNSKIKALLLSVIDTTIGNTTGKYIRGYAKSDTSTFQEFHSFMTVKNNHGYFVQAILFQLKGAGTDDAIKDFYKKVRFDGKSYTSNPQSSAYKAGYVFGKIIVFVLLIGLVVFIIIRLTKK
jgi:hypothetical protein